MATLNGIEEIASLTTVILCSRFSRCRESIRSAKCHCYDTSYSIIFNELDHIQMSLICIINRPVVLGLDDPRTILVVAV